MIIRSISIKDIAMSMDIMMTNNIASGSTYVENPQNHKAPVKSSTKAYRKENDAPQLAHFPLKIK